MKRFSLWLLGNVVILGLLAGLLVWIYRPQLPDGYRHLNATAQGGWYVSVSYKPGAREAQIALRMDGLSRYRVIEFEAVPPEAWAPRWQARIEGRPISEYLTLNDGRSQTPVPKTDAVAGALARSYQVRLRLDGEERVIDFREAQVSYGRPLLMLGR